MACKNAFLDLEVIQTDTKTWRFVITNADKTPIDISGYLLFFTVKKNLDAADEDALIAKTTTCPDNADSEAGIGFIELTSEDTNIAVDNYSYDIKIQKNEILESGEEPVITWRKTIATGTFKVNRTGTKRVS